MKMRFLSINFLLMSLIGSITSARPPLTNNSYVFRSHHPHQVRLLNEGTVSFNQILKTIREAQKSIDLEYFIFKDDLAGKLIVHELIKKSKRGLKIRLLIDHSSFFIKLNDLFAHRLKNYGVDVRYFNRSTRLSPYNLMWRNHRKLLIADNIKAIIGGRNIADEYFDQQPDYNFLDRDVFIEGPITKQMTKSFDLFWNSSLATKPDDTWYLREELNGWSRLKAIYFKINQFFTRDKVSDARLLTHELIGQPLLDKVPTYQCPEVIFAFDGASIPRSSTVHEVYLDLLKSTVQDHLIETPYLILKNKTYDQLLTFIENGGKLTTLTNGLHSTDAAITYSAMLEYIKEPIKKGAKIYIYGGGRPFYPMVSAAAAKGIWGIHSKTFIFDHRHTMISTFNLDPRSERFNSELSFVCLNNPDFANATAKSIYDRINGSGLLDSEGKPSDHRFPYLKEPFYIRAGLAVFSPFVRYFDDYL